MDTPQQIFNGYKLSWGNDKNERMVFGTVFRNNKWQIYTKGLLAWTVTDTVAYAFN